METKFQTDLNLEIKFSKTIKSILGNQFFTKEEKWDLEKATDFLIMKAEPVKIACRLRRHSQYIKKNFKDEFTIRYSRPSGVKTEIHKIYDGHVDYMFYGFINQDENRIIQYFIADLNVFRYHQPEPWKILPNQPLDSHLAVFRLKQLPAEFILKFYKVEEPNG